VLQAATAISRAPPTRASRANVAPVDGPAVPESVSGKTAIARDANTAPQVTIPITERFIDPFLPKIE
jgi:hypothetical protein